MARRRQPETPAADRATVPEYLRNFHPEDWVEFPYDLAEARRRFFAARERWAAGRGCRAGELAQPRRQS